MIKRFIYRYLWHRHYWRHISFSELAELYTSSALRNVAMSMASVFIAVYLYQAGFSLSKVMLYFAFYYGIRVLAAYPFAHIIAWIGPKKATLVSNLIYVPALLLLALVPAFGVEVLIAGGIFQALSVTLYEIAYLTEFSKIKNDQHSGKELGYMHMLEQVSKAVSPIIGGMLAYLFSPQVTLVVASVVFMLAATPLLLTPDTALTRQKIILKGIDWQRIRPQIASSVGNGFDYVVSGIIWSLFIAITVFDFNTNLIYAELGFLSSFTLIISVIVAKVFGIIVDGQKGGELLKAGVIMNGLTHIARIFALTPFGVVMVNILNEIATIAYMMPYKKGMFASADDLPGYRIIYITLMSGAASFGAAVLCLILAYVMSAYPSQEAFKICFIIGGAVVLVLLCHNFPALKRRRF